MERTWKLLIVFTYWPGSSDSGASVTSQVVEFATKEQAEDARLQFVDKKHSYDVTRLYSEHA